MKNTMTWPLWGFGLSAMAALAVCSSAGAQGLPLPGTVPTAPRVVLPGRQIAPPLLLRTDYAENEDGWQVFGEGAKVARVSDMETGKGALRYDYKVAKGSLSALFLPVSENEIGGARTFRFSVKADQATTVAMILQEQDGGRFLALFYVPAAKWQPVTLGITDFQLSKGPDDPKDADGKLDTRKIQMLALADVGQLFIQADANIAKLLFNVTPGARSISLGEFTASTEPSPGASFYSASDARLDTFAHPQVGWVALGETMLERATSGPLTGSGIKATYKQEAAKIAGAVRPIPQGRLAGRDRLGLTIASEKPGTLLVQVEERDGGKYNYPVTLTGKKADAPLSAQELVLPFADFKPSDDSKDTNNKLDPGEVYQILLLEVAGLLGTGKGEQNTLYIGGLRAPIGASTASTTTGK